NQMNTTSQAQEIKDKNTVEVDGKVEKQETVKVQPIDLFSPFSKKPNNLKADYEVKEPIVRHTLIEEEELEQEEELDVKDGYVLKQSESEFHFKLTDE